MELDNGFSPGGHLGANPPVTRRRYRSLLARLCSKLRYATMMDARLLKGSGDWLVRKRKLHHARDDQNQRNFCAVPEI